VTTQPGSEEPRFSARLMLWLVLVGGAAFCAFLVLLALVPRPDEQRAGGGHALSRSAIGYAGLVALLRAQGVPVSISSEWPPEPADGLLVATPPPEALAKALDRTMLLGQRRLVVLPKWATAPDPAHPGWVQRRGVIPAAALSGPVRIRRDFAAGPWPEEADGTPWVTQAIEGDGVRLLTDRAGRILVGYPAGLPGAVVADPDLLDNLAMATPSRARLAADLIDRLRDGGPVRFDVALNGLGGERGLLRTAFRPPFLAATLCAAAACLLLGLRALARFGPVRAAGAGPAFGKALLADSAAALIVRSGRLPGLAAPYAALVRLQVARAIGAPAALAGPALDALLDRAGAARGLRDSAAGLAREAATVASGAALLALAARIAAWREDMLRGDR
jgi:hypothetical protein